MRGHAFHQRQEGGVEEHVAVFGVIDDIGDLFREQPGIDGVADGAHAGDAVVDLQVAIAVPRQRADSFTLLHAQRAERLGHLAGPQLAVAVGVAVEVALGPPRDDFCAGVIPRSVLDDGGNEQRRAHHLTHQCHETAS
ncbi:hypothetical protein D3C72_1669190 [compost metagenome]